MDKTIDIILGWPGLVVLVVLILAGIANTSGGESEKSRCEAAGGKYVQTMKSYHTCRLPNKAI